MSDFREMRDRAFNNAEMKDVYDCWKCDGSGKVRNNTTIDDRKYKFSKIKCDGCGGCGYTPRINILQKLKEETLEFQTAIRNKYCSDITIFNKAKFPDNNRWKELFEQEIKDTEGDELADIVIVCLAASKKLGIDLHKHIEAKLRYNEVR